MSPVPRLDERRARGPGRVFWKRACALAAGLSIGVLARASPRVKPSTVASADDRAIRGWVEGPVRYLMGREEYERVRSIGSIPDLARYITAFWARRDPSPGTFENEFRRQYWARVLEANHRYNDAPMAGWKTDRGKVFILLGEPDYIETDEHPEVSLRARRQSGPLAAPEAGQRGLQRWFYRRQFSKAAEPAFVVAFVRDASLAWKLSSNPELSGDILSSVPKTGEDDPSFGGIESARATRLTGTSAATGAPGGSAASPGSPLARFPGDIAAELAQIQSPFDTSLFANYDLGLEMSVPSNAQLAIATVSARGFLSGFSGSTRFEFFRARDGSTFVNIGALVPRSDLWSDLKSGTSDLRVYASLASVADPSRVVYATNEREPARYDLTAESPAGGMVDVWTGVAIPAGRYDATLAIEDSLTGRLGRASAVVEVPDLSKPALSLSTIVLASSLAQSQGRLGVTPRASSAFRRTEEFGVYFEVYGLPEGRTARHFDVSYRFERDEEGRSVDVGPPIDFPDRTEPVQGWSFPLSKWPLGRFRIVVTVTDSRGTKVSSGAAFDIVE